MLGQDRHAVLFGVDAGELTTTDFNVFAIPKANLYGNVATDFPLFHTDSSTAAEPVTNAGNPMIDSASAYFVAASPDPQFGLAGNRFGDFSSVAVDPAIGDGTCAVTAQEYVAAADSWAVRIGRLCGQSQVTIPNVVGGTVDAARAALTAAFLRGDPTTTTSACDNGSQGLVVGSSPPAGSALGIGQEVTLVTCDRNVRVPDTTDDTVDVASSKISSAGLVVGSTSSCDVLPGLVISTSPKAGNLVLIGTTVNLRVSSGRPRTGCE